MLNGVCHPPVREAGDERQCQPRCVSPAQPHGGAAAQIPLSSLPPAFSALPRCGSRWSWGTQPVVRGWTGSQTPSWTVALLHFPEGSREGG